MMSRKSISTSLLLLFSVSIFSSFILIGSAQSGNWNVPEIISNNLGNSPVVDGSMEDLWLDESVNSSHCNLGYEFNLYAQHNGTFIFFLIETEYTTSQSSETFSIIISSDNSSENFYDKKQITMNNADEKGNETSSIKDLYLEDEEYITNSAINFDSFEGAARYSNSSSATRYYEFQIRLSPENETQDAKIVGYQNYAIQVELNFTDDAEALVSNTLLVQVGPEPSKGDPTFTERDINVALYILIVMISVSSIYVVYGLVLISSKSKIGEIHEEGN